MIHDTKSPIISIYMPTRNRPGLAKMSIDSVLCQTFQDFELIVVDDGSTGENFEILKKIVSKDARIRLLRQEISGGAPSARNYAIKNSKGLYVTGIDDDDLWCEDRLKLFFDAVDDDDCDMLMYSDDVFFTDKDEKLWAKKVNISHADLLVANEIGNQVFARRDKWIAAGLFDEALGAAQDHDMWLRLFEICSRTKYVPGAVQYIRLAHGGRMSRNKRHWEYMGYYKKHKQKMSDEQRRSYVYYLYLCFKKPRLLRFIAMLCYIPRAKTMTLIKKRVLKQWYVI